MEEILKTSQERKKTKQREVAERKAKREAKLQKARQKKAKEKQKEQGVVIKLSGLMFVAGFVLAGLDFRFQWWQLPPVCSYISAGIFLLSYVTWAVVLKQNAYLSRTIKVEEGQKLIDKGLYGIIRHPMYTATVFLFLSMPLVLGSMVAFFVFLL